MSTSPRVSIGLPVRNGEQYIRRAIESVLAQDYQDLELVICDNESDDSTCEIVRSYADQDQRIKLHQNPRDIGQIGNMNRVFELASGEYFRWTGDDDWFDPSYLSRCVEFLDREPQFIGVSTYLKYFDDLGNEYYAEYTGERFESPQPHRRFSRLLWFSHADYRYCDPHYTMFRRSVLEQTQLCQVVFATDLILAAEVSLLGPSGHIPECLAYRRRNPLDYAQTEGVEERYHPDQPAALRRSVGQICSKFDEIVRDSSLSGLETAACRAAIAGYFLQEERRVHGGRLRDAARRLPGYQIVKAALRR